MAVFCVHLIIDHPQTRVSGVVRQGRRHWTVHHVQNHTLLDPSPSASQAGRRVGSAVCLAFGLLDSNSNYHTYLMKYKK
jgi:hypothetical protein